MLRLLFNPHVCNDKQRLIMHCICSLNKMIYDFDLGVQMNLLLRANCNSATCHLVTVSFWDSSGWLFNANAKRNWKTCHFVELCLMTNYIPCIQITVAFPQQMLITNSKTTLYVHVKNFTIVHCMCVSLFSKSKWLLCVVIKA